MRKWILIPATVIIFAAAIAAGIVWWRISKPPELPVPEVRIAPPGPPPQVVIPKALPLLFRRGDRIGEIEIPRLNLRVAVYEGDDAAILKLGAGHVPGTALPGAPGNVCIAAHRDKFFRALRFIRPHDEIVLRTKQGELRYVVSSMTIVRPTEVQALMPAPHRDLTLVTCYPFYYVGHAPRRFIVHASREDDVLTASGRQSRG